MTYANKKIIFALFLTFAVGGILTFAHVRGGDGQEAVSSAGFGSGYKAVMYKSPTCGCCTKYANELENVGFDVEVVSSMNMDAVKDQHDIPNEKQSCHTIAIGDYFVEGHVPMEAIEKLLDEKPAISGIGLAGMPAGTPGMPGPQRAPFAVYQSSGGAVSEFLTLR